jgi:hypothetical protein
MRLDKFLAAADRLASRSKAVAALERGKVFVNDLEASSTDAARRLAARDRVRVWMDRPGSARRRPSAHRTSKLVILYEDDDLIAIDKPAGLLTVPLPRAIVWLAALIAEGIGRTRGRPMPLNLARVGELWAPGFVCRVDRIREQLNVAAEVDLPEGLADTAAWYEREGWL